MSDGSDHRLDLSGGYYIGKKGRKHTKIFFTIILFLLLHGMQAKLQISDFVKDGGFVKYNFPMAFSTTMVAWGVIEFRKAYLASHQIPHVMNALKWTTDYFLKCHVSPFAFYAQVLKQLIKLESVA